MAVPRAARRLLCPLGLALVFAGSAAALEFDMLFQTKCVMEEISKNVLAVIDYEGFKREAPEQKVPLSVKVEDPYGDVVYVKDNTEGEHYSFTTKRQGDYKVCFTAKDLATAKATKVRLDWKTGVAATDWDAIAKKDNLNTIAAELKRMEELTKEIHEEMLTMKQREMGVALRQLRSNQKASWRALGQKVKGLCEVTRLAATAS